MPEGRGAKRGRARERAQFLDGRLPPVDRSRIAEATARTLEEAASRRGPGSRAARAFAAAPSDPDADRRRWVPIGPAVVRRGQANGRPRMTGRIRDVAVDPFFQRRIYVATAKGGVWYSRDGGATWNPVGGWTARSRTAGGTNSGVASSCLLVHFDPVDEREDVVLVGTGEPPVLVSSVSASQAGGTLGDHFETALPDIHGVGVLAAVGVGAATAGSEPWEPESGLALMENHATYRLARDPRATPGSTGPATDRVVAATSRGLVLGTRQQTGGQPAYEWSLVAPAGTPLAGNPVVSDVLWLPGTGGDRDDGLVVAALAGPGPAQQAVVVVRSIGSSPTTTAVTGIAAGARTRMSLAHAADARIYLLGEAAAPVAPTLWRVPDVTASAPAATVVPGLPGALWPGQRDYDQALAVTANGAQDRVFVGGSGLVPPNNTEFSAALYAFDVGAGPQLVPAAGLATTAAPPAGAGADVAGLIGNNVHADVHRILPVATVGGGTEVWVTCDGGVYASARGGQVNTFASRATGLAVLEVGFHAGHPSSSHFGIVGTQDLGCQVRVGDTVWEQTFRGDGGGVAFHPTRSQYVITQNRLGFWSGQPANGFVSPLNRTPGGGGVQAPYNNEHAGSAWYSGLATVGRTERESRVAIGTTRVWLSDDVGAAPTNTWNVLPIGTGVASADRAGYGPDPGTTTIFGLPNNGNLGPVLRLRWVTPNHLLALYLQGIVRYRQAASGTWTSTIVLPGGAAAAPAFLTRRQIYTDIAPVGKTDDFYLTTSGDPTDPTADTCFLFDHTTGPNGTFRPTGLRRKLDSSDGAGDGPLDPAYAVVVDPVGDQVYVGTVGGVYRGESRAAGQPHRWDPEVNGLPEALVQDLTIWRDPDDDDTDPRSPRLLRAAIQSRGVWEMDLALDREPRRTYVRVHERDDRRRLPSPLADPRRRPGTPDEPWFASPDVVVRPQWPLAQAPRWLLGGATIDADPRHQPRYQLWTFQTAFRWHFPSLVADGRWSDQLADLIQQFRADPARAALAGGGPVIDRALWEAVVGGTRLDPLGVVSAAAADPLAVYRAPWHVGTDPDAAATEIDLLDGVVPRSLRAHVWRVHREPVTVDVLLHHRDTRPLDADDAFVVLLWRDRASQATALGGSPAAFPDFARSLLTAAPSPTPGGWNLVETGGSPLHRLPVPLDARLPRAVSIDVDLSAVGSWRRVTFVALVGSSVDELSAAPSGAVNNLEQLTQRWPYAAVRLVQVQPRA